MRRLDATPVVPHRAVLQRAAPEVPTPASRVGALLWQGRGSCRIRPLQVTAPSYAAMIGVLRLRSPVPPFFEQHTRAPRKRRLSCLCCLGSRASVGLDAGEPGVRTFVVLAPATRPLAGVLLTASTGPTSPSIEPVVPGSSGSAIAPANSAIHRRPTRRRTSSGRVAVGRPPVIRRASPCGACVAEVSIGRGEPSALDPPVQRRTRDATGQVPDIRPGQQRVRIVGNAGTCAFVVGRAAR